MAPSRDQKDHYNSLPASSRWISPKHGRMTYDTDSTDCTTPSRGHWGAVSPRKTFHERHRYNPHGKSAGKGFGRGVSGKTSKRERRKKEDCNAPMPDSISPSLTPPPCSSSVSSLDRSVTSSSFSPPEAVFVPPPCLPVPSSEEIDYYKKAFPSYGSTESSTSPKLKRLKKAKTSQRVRSRTPTSVANKRAARPRATSPYSARSVASPSALKLGARVVSILSYMLIFSLVVIVFTLHNMSTPNLAASITYHPQLEPADLVEKGRVLSLQDLKKKRKKPKTKNHLRAVESELVALALNQTLDVESTQEQDSGTKENENENEKEKTKKGSKESKVSKVSKVSDGSSISNKKKTSNKVDSTAIGNATATSTANTNTTNGTVIGALHFDKPISDITWRDLNFSISTSHAPSCKSQGRMDAADISFTLVTQVSSDRLWMLTEHCKRWPGPISAAVFTDQSVREIQRELSRTTKQNKKGGHSLYGSCKKDQLRIQAMSTQGIPQGEYPVNTLRNLALQGVKTSHIFYADIDFWESKNLYNTLHSKFIRQQLSSDPQLALVVPAFQIARQCKEVRDCREENMETMPHTKKELISLVMDKRASAFDPTNRGGHGSTSYSDWFRMEEGDLWDIPCITSNRYEPYMAVRYCNELPPFQEVFTGYGKNKMTQIMQMRRAGYVFSQIGGAFVVHYPHLSSRERITWNKGKKHRDKLLEKKKTTKTTDWTKYKRGRVDKLFVEFKRWLGKETADNARVPMCEDKQDDDQKLWV